MLAGQNSVSKPSHGQLIEFLFLSYSQQKIVSIESSPPFKRIEKCLECPSLKNKLNNPENKVELFSIKNAPQLNLLVVYRTRLSYEKMLSDEEYAQLYLLNSDFQSPKLIYIELDHFEVKYPTRILLLKREMQPNGKVQILAILNDNQLVQGHLDVEKAQFSFVKDKLIEFGSYWKT